MLHSYGRHMSSCQSSILTAKPHSHLPTTDTKCLKKPVKRLEEVEFETTVRVAIAFKQLTFNGQTGRCRPIKCASFASESKNNVLQWGFTWNSAPAAAGNCI